jgi:NADH-quinone oxidoreductase subunit J
MIELGMFVACCGFAIAGAVGAASVRNLFHAALLLGMCLLGVAGLYLFLQAPYLACIQVIVYVGGILVLILFATLFSADIMGKVQRSPWGLRVAGLVGAVLAAGISVRLAQLVGSNGQGLDRTRGPVEAVPDAIAGGRHSIGELLTGPWLVPFLLGGILLLTALVGAVATVTRFRRRPEANHG